MSHPSATLAAPNRESNTGDLGKPHDLGIHPKTSLAWYILRQDSPRAPRDPERTTLGTATYHAAGAFLVVSVAVTAGAGIGRLVV